MRAEVDPPKVIVLFVLLLVTLVVLALIFSSQMRSFVGSLIGMKPDINRCNSLPGRYCDSCPDGFSVSNTVPPPSGGWGDECTRCVECVKARDG